MDTAENASSQVISLLRVREIEMETSGRKYGTGDKGLMSKKESISMLQVTCWVLQVDQAMIGGSKDSRI